MTNSFKNSFPYVENVKEIKTDVQYEYDINGTKQIGKSRTNNFELTNNKAIGDTVRILISRDGKNSCLYPEIIAKTHEWKEN